MRRRYKILLALVAIIGAPYYWLLIDNRPGDDPGPVIRIADLRRLADTIPGPHPEAVAIQQIGWRRVPGTLFVAGGGLKRNLLSIGRHPNPKRTGDSEQHQHCHEHPQ